MLLMFDDQRQSFRSLISECVPPNRDPVGKAHYLYKPVYITHSVRASI